MAENKQWWGEHRFSLDETKCWRIGERCIAIRRAKHEWTVWNRETSEELDKPIIVNKPKSRESFKDDKFERFMLSETTDRIDIEPSLAERAMVVRPSKPIIIMPNEQAKLFVSTPLWMTVSIEGKEEPMADIPFWRPSDSWFGSSTMSGDLCYAKYTDAKMDQDDLGKRAHRALTMVTVTNDQDTPLTIQRLNIPVPTLRIYVNQEGVFWTDQVNILQRTEHSKPISHVSHNPPENVKAMTQVSESREMSKKASFISSIKNLIS